MNKKTPEEMIQIADAMIKKITPAEVMNDKKEYLIIDVREAEELQSGGKIENAINIPRGLLEFSLNPNGALIQNNIIDTKKDIVLFCAAGGRSALAAKTLKDMGFKNVSHVDGGFPAMKQAGFKVKK